MKCATGDGYVKSVHEPEFTDETYLILSLCFIFQPQDAFDYIKVREAAQIELVEKCPLHSCLQGKQWRPSLL